MQGVEHMKRSGLCIFVYLCLYVSKPLIRVNSIQGIIYDWISIFFYILLIYDEIEFKKVGDISQCHLVKKCRRQKVLQGPPCSVRP